MKINFVRALFAAGCLSFSMGVAHADDDAEMAGKKIDKAADKTEAELKDAGRKTKAKAKKAKRKTGEAVEDAGKDMKD